jgi:hypothetical protein
MIKKILNRKAIQAIRHRRNSLNRFLDTCVEFREKLKDDPAKKTEYDQWDRMYWDAWSREEELSTLEDYLTS